MARRNTRDAFGLKKTVGDRTEIAALKRRAQALKLNFAARASPSEELCRSRVPARPAQKLRIPARAWRRNDEGSACRPRTAGYWWARNGRRSTTRRKEDAPSANMWQRLPTRSIGKKEAAARLGVVAVIVWPTADLDSDDRQACQTPKPASRRPMASSTSISRAASSGIGLYTSYSAGSKRRPYSKTKRLA